MAKEFIYNELIKDRKIYISKDLNKILEITNGKTISVFAVVDTEAGEVLCEVDLTYSGEPFIWKRFMHKDSFLKFNNDKEVIII